MDGYVGYFHSHTCYTKLISKFWLSLDSKLRSRTYERFCVNRSFEKTKKIPSLVSYWSIGPVVLCAFLIWDTPQRSYSWTPSLYKTIRSTCHFYYTHYPTFGHGLHPDILCEVLAEVLGGEELVVADEVRIQQYKNVREERRDYCSCWYIIVKKRTTVENFSLLRRYSSVSL
jgi:hypothetical protein